MTTQTRDSDIEDKVPSSIFQFEALDIDGNKVSLDRFSGKVCLVVNVASKWGSTKVSYEELQALYEKYHSAGFEVLAFPCNQFGGQEPGTNPEIKEFATKRFNVTFTLFSKVNVNGKDVHPLWEFLKNEKTGLLGTSAIKWNFTKFLCNRRGVPINRYGTQSTPMSFEQDIVALLEEK